jgi:hypothetical protein
VIVEEPFVPDWVTSAVLPLPDWPTVEPLPEPLWVTVAFCVVPLCVTPDVLFCAIAGDAKSAAAETERKRVRFMVVSPSSRVDSHAAPARANMV